jgi:2',3'-cyclic-nucleotide 2'-phosphodiesterase (5'-nucleotidase family)
VGGHTHELIAGVVEGTAVLQAGARGAFLSRATLCEGRPPIVHPPDRLRPGEPFLGEVLAPEPRVAAAVAARRAAAQAERDRPVGVRLARALPRSRTGPSPFGAAAAQSLRSAARADFGLVNAGSLRLDLPAGELRHGDLFEALPFDDRLVVLTLRGDEIADLVARLARSGKGYPQLAGLVLQADGPRTCAGGRLEPRRRYTVATNEFLATGGDQPGKVRLPAGRVRLVEDAWIRPLLAEWLRTAPPERVAEACP